MQNLKEYRDEINNIFARYTRKGFVDYRNCSYLERDMVILLSEASRDLSQRGMYKDLFEITNKAFLKWAKTDKDDSLGETDSFCWSVKEAWDIIYKADDPKINHKKMFKWFIKYLDGSVIDYMEDRLYDFLIDNFKENYFLELKYRFYEQKIAFYSNIENTHLREFYVDKCGEYMLICMSDMNKPIEEIRQYAQTINSTSIPEILVNIELKYNNFEEAISIYNKLANEEDNRSFYHNKWHIKLKNLYKQLNNNEKYISELSIAVSKYIGDEDLWREYKSLFTEDEWKTESEKIFSTIKTGNYSAYTWYNIEKRYDLIIAGLENVFNINILKKYEKYLKKLYPERILNILKKHTEYMAEIANKRSDYRDVAKMISWIQKYPHGNEEASILVDKFRDTYKRRRAMMEELDIF